MRPVTRTGRAHSSHRKASSCRNGIFEGDIGDYLRNTRATLRLRPLREVEDEHVFSNSFLQWDFKGKFSTPRGCSHSRVVTLANISAWNSLAKNAMGSSHGTFCAPL